MSKPCEITDEEFVPFLHSLGVETFNKSFEWMLSDPKFADFFTWLHNNLDNNNALTAREKFRYAELQNTGQILSPADLEFSIESIQQQYPGICLPGDQELLEDVKHDITMMNEKLVALEKQEKVLKTLIKQNEQIKENLTLDATKLNSVKQQLVADEEEAGRECLVLAKEVDTLTEGVFDVISNALDVYANCHMDKDLSKNFFTFGPLDAYHQSQALFRSHFDLYTARKFDKLQNDRTEDLRNSVVQAKSLEGRLSDAVFAYIESKAELCGEQAKLALVSNYNNVHPSQIPSLSVEAQTAIDLLTQEEPVLEQQIQNGVKQLVTSRSQMVLHAATSAVLDIRQQALTDLTHLLETSIEAATIDKILYRALRGELRTIEECAHFASQLHMYINAEASPVSSRIKSMTQIMAQQEEAIKNMPKTDILVQTLGSILGSQCDTRVMNKMFVDLQNKVRDLKGDVEDGYKKKEAALVAFKKSYRPLQNYIFTGSTKQPNAQDRVVASLSHSLVQLLEREEKTVVDLGGHMISVKNGDKQNHRKLWQWFLADPPRLLAAVKGFQASSYNSSFAATTFSTSGNDTESETTMRW